MLNSGSSSRGDMVYVPSSVTIIYKYIYSIEVNRSGRLQYYRQPVDGKRIRITKTEFSKVYNHDNILAIEPVQHKKDPASHFLVKFYTL